MKKPIQAVLIGAGQRGTDAYGHYALQHPDEMKIVAIIPSDNWPNLDIIETSSSNAEYLSVIPAKGPLKSLFAL